MADTTPASPFPSSPPGASFPDSLPTSAPGPVRTHDGAVPHLVTPYSARPASTLIAAARLSRSGSLELPDDTHMTPPLEGGAFESLFTQAPFGTGPIASSTQGADLEDDPLAADLAEVSATPTPIDPHVHR